MKLLRMFLVVALAMLVSSVVAAQCAHQPVPGSYKTLDGTMIGGRASEAFCSGAGPGVPGNTQNAESWNGAALGTQWKIWGMAIDAAGAVETARSINSSGTGWIDYVTNYAGGFFWLSGSHTWGDGLGDFSGTITYYNVGTKVSYFMGMIVGVTSNITLRGQFADCPYCFIDYSLANSMLIWKTGDGAPMPANYPPFLCGANGGELHDICCVTLNIVCDPTATETSTWGAIKDLYR
ncbi:MAG: hypothetical protein C4574_05920 [Candidatus Latescibacterota bacterium]|nr:MAG: hypothetical protein C4574_05920 [Candidatus Latescibacterota bacterium]